MCQGWEVGAWDIPRPKRARRARQAGDHSTIRQGKAQEWRAVEGLLMRFADGVYTVKQPETLAEIRESDIWEITFVGPNLRSRETTRCASDWPFCRSPPVSKT